MKCVSINQPNAFLVCGNPLEIVAAGETPRLFENRPVWTPYRGRVLIHAGKSRRYIGPECRRMIPKLIFGSIIGSAELVDVVGPQKYLGRKPIFGRVTLKYYPWLENADDAVGPFVWIFENVFAHRPIPFTGRKGLFEVPDSILARVDVASAR